MFVKKCNIKARTNGYHVVSPPCQMADIACMEEKVLARKQILRSVVEDFSM